MGLNSFFLHGISQHITPFHSGTLSEVQLFLSSFLIYRARDLESGWFGFEFQLYHFWLCNSYLTSLEPQSSCM